MKILFLCNYRSGVGGISGQVELLQRYLQAEGFTAEVFSTRGTFLRRLLLPLRLRRVARQYDVLHVHCCSGWGFLPAVVGIAVGRQMGKRLVLTYHGGAGDVFFNRHPKLVKHFLSHTDANIVPSGFLSTVFERHSLSCLVIPNILSPVQANNDLPLRLSPFTAIRPHFICTRAHEELYNIPCILLAFRRVQEQVPEATLTLIGDGSQHRYLVRLAQKLELSNVTFTGRVDNGEIFHYLHHASIFLSASTVDNMPVSVLEAMYAGLLVIASRVGGVPYIIENGSTGLLFESNDSDGLARQMLWALKDQASARTIIRQARQAVLAHSWDNIKEKLLFAYGIPT